MDIVLEVLDTYALDRLYATLLPASTALFPFNAVKQAAGATANATFSSMRELPTHTSYEYHPASQYLQLQPTEWAYMSAWDRNNIYRQIISIFTIGWWGTSPPRSSPSLPSPLSPSERPAWTNVRVCGRKWRKDETS